MLAPTAVVDSAHCKTIAATNATTNNQRVRGGLIPEFNMSLGTILLIVLVLALVGVIPAWPHSRGWGYGPTGIVGVLVIVLLILFLMGKL